ncbi:MAG TPA: hypothetical protein VGA28_01805 [Desulfurivibrionaceae bacterium]
MIRAPWWVRSPWSSGAGGGGRHAGLVPITAAVEIAMEGDKPTQVVAKMIREE